MNPSKLERTPLTVKEFGEWPPKAMHAWWRRLVYGYVFWALLALFLFVAMYALFTIFSSISVLSLAIGFLVGLPLVGFEYLVVRSKARVAQEMARKTGESSITIRPRRGGRIETLVEFVAYFLLVGSIPWVGRMVGGEDVFSFVMGILLSLGVMLPVIGHLLEIKFGKI